MKLDEVIPRGRSFEEYTRMLALTRDDLVGTVLGCGDGPERLREDRFENFSSAARFPQ